MKKKDILALLFITLSSFIALRALFIPNFYTSHDGLTHTARLANFYLAISEGQYPPRLAPQLFGGLGYPIFLFIYPLPYAVGSLFHLLGFSYTDSFEIVIGLSFLLSATTMYLFIKNTMNRLAGILAALFYTWAPYRFSQIYVRGAIAESFAYIFIPLIMLSIFKLKNKKSWRWVVFGAISLSCLLLSHQMVSIMFLPVLVLYGIYLFFKTKHRLIFSVQSAVLVLLGFSIAAYIYIPSLFERYYLRFDNLISYYQDHFVTIGQLIHSPWSYGFSFPGTNNDDMSFQVGLTHILVVVITLLLLLPKMIKSRLNFFKSNAVVALLFFSVFLISIILTLELPVTHWLWKNLPALEIVDFPWRLLGVSVMAVSILAAWCYYYSSSKILAAALLILLFIANRNHLRINQTVIITDDYFDAYQETATWLNEFLTKWRETNNWQGLGKDISIKEGIDNYYVTESKTHNLRIEVETLSGGELLIHRLYFPGWEVWDNGIRLVDDQFRVSNEKTEDIKTGITLDKSGLLALNIKPGYHVLDVKFKETNLRKIGFLLSIVGLVVSLRLLLINQNRIG
jgi:uncharacterized membrane protein